MQPDDKLNIDSLTLDNVIGDGVETVEDVQDVVEEVPQEVEEEVQDENVDPEVGDEDADDDYYEQPEEEKTYVEDEYEEEDGEPASVAAEVARTLGFELEGDYDDSLEGITNFVRDISQNAAEDRSLNIVLKISFHSPLFTPYICLSSPERLVSHLFVPRIIRTNRRNETDFDSSIFIDLFFVKVSAVCFSM